MQHNIDTAVVTETVFDVPDADMYLVARRDEHALIYAVDDHSDGKPVGRQSLLERQLREQGARLRVAHLDGDVQR
jgi:hypothetical protein